LFIQAQKLVRLSLPTALILEGKLADLAHIQVRRESLQGAMICLNLIFRLPVLRALDPPESAKLMGMPPSNWSGTKKLAQRATDGVRSGKLNYSSTSCRVCPESDLGGRRNCWPPSAPWRR